jgi:NADPH:quinone reductase-like Zn-dependent oxidoreductase
LPYKIRLAQDLEAFAWPRFAQKEVRPVIDSVFDWVDVEKAHARMEANENVGKIILRVS